MADAQRPRPPNSVPVYEPIAPQLRSSSGTAGTPASRTGGSAALRARQYGVKPAGATPENGRAGPPTPTFEFAAPAQRPISGVGAKLVSHPVMLSTTPSAGAARPTTAAIGSGGGQVARMHPYQQGQAAAATLFAANGMPRTPAGRPVSGGGADPAAAAAQPPPSPVVVHAWQQGSPGAGASLYPAPRKVSSTNTSVISNDSGYSGSGPSPQTSAQQVQQVSGGGAQCDAAGAAHPRA